MGGRRFMLLLFFTAKADLFGLNELIYNGIKDQIMNNVDETSEIYEYLDGLGLY